MIDENSRYFHLAVEQHELADGRVVRCQGRRLLPESGRLGSPGQVEVQVGDRWDSIAARELGDPEHFWRLCDVNNVMNPWALEPQPGDRLGLPFPPGLDNGEGASP